MRVAPQTATEGLVAGSIQVSSSLVLTTGCRECTLSSSPGDVQFISLAVHPFSSDHNLVIFKRFYRTPLREETL